MGFSLVLIYGKVALNHLSTKGLLSHGSKDPLAGQSLSFWVSDCPFNADAQGRGFFSRKVCLGVPPLSVVGGTSQSPRAETVQGAGLGGPTLAHFGWALAAAGPCL